MCHSECPGTQERHVPPLLAMFLFNAVSLTFNASVELDN